MNTIRAYSRRAESFGAAPPASAAPSTEEREATVRARRRSSTRAEEAEFEQDGATRDTSRTCFSRSSLFVNSRLAAPLKSVLRPPKLAPSAWQLYFTDWIQRQQANSSRKLNVAQAAKEAGQEYASLSEEEKEVRVFLSALYSLSDVLFFSYFRALTLAALQTPLAGRQRRPRAPARVVHAHAHPRRHQARERLPRRAAQGKSPKMHIK
jgi:hypothetical protein